MIWCGGEEYELDGVDYIRFTGAVSTLELDEDWEEPDRVPFGFRAPAPRPCVVRVPVLSSRAWGRWLDR